MSAFEKPKICFLVLIGLPGCGKTTFAMHLGKLLEETFEVEAYPFHNVIHICYDKIIYQSDEVQWNEARRAIVQSVYDVIDKMNKNADVHSAVQQHNWKIFEHNIAVSSNHKRTLIVLDDNMYYRSMRYQYFQIARAYQLGYTQLYLKCKLEECLQRNSFRNCDEKIPEHIICNMATNIQEPNMNNTWERFSTVIPSDQPLNQSFLNCVLTLINKGFANPVQPNTLNVERELSQQTCSTNIYHNADLIMRKSISNIINKNKHIQSKKIQELSRDLNKRKQVILQNLKLRKLHFPEEIIKGIEKGHTHAITALEELLSQKFIEEN